MLYQCLGHQHDVIGRGVVVIRIKPRAVDKVRVVHAECFRLFIHKVGKGRLRPRDRFAQGNRRIVG